MSDIQEISR